MTRPLSLTFVSVLFILAGAYAALNIVADFIRGSININLAVICLFIGFGLLRLHPGWRICALVFLWFFFLSAVLAAGIDVFGDSAQVALFELELTRTELRLVAIVVDGLLAALLCWMYRVLVRQDVKYLFERRAASLDPNLSGRGK